MSSAFINQIRILKPRKKIGRNNSLESKSITPEQDVNSSKTTLLNEVLPPLKPILDTSSKNIHQDKTVKVYVVSVPNLSKPGTVVVTSAAPRPAIPSSNMSNLIQSPISDSSQKFLLIQTSQSNIITNNNSSTANGITNIDSNIKVKSLPAIKPKEPINKVKTFVNCFLCPMVFESIEKLQKHYLTQHKQKKRGHSNNNIESDITQCKTQVMEKVDILSEGEPKCPICSIYFKTKEEVKDHMERVHIYNCSECHRRFYTLFQFTDHKCNKSKRIKIVPNSICETQFPVIEEDPLALPPLQNPTNQGIVSSNTFPSSEKNIETSTFPDGNTNFDTPFSSSVMSSSSTTSSSAIPSIYPSKITNNKRSLLDCTFEELRSKELNKEKLRELMSNPSFSVRLIKKKETVQNLNDYSCARCNVICDNMKDYLQHIKLCFRLSNVAMISNGNSPKKLLNLKSELVSSKNLPDSKTSINKKLLSQLKNSLGGASFEELFKSEEKPDSSSETLLDSKVTNDYYKSTDVSDIIDGDNKSMGKNVSSNRIPNDTSFTQSFQRSLDGRGLPTTALQVKQQPMVIIPLNSNGNIDSGEGKSLDPDISITDKNSNLTWNINEPTHTSSTEYEDNLMDNSKSASEIQINSEEENVSSVHHNKNLDSALVKSSKLDDKASEEYSNHFDDITIKCEPLSPMASSSSASSIDLDAEASTFPTLELFLENEDDIKMEIDEECITDDNNY